MRCIRAWRRTPGDAVAHGKIGRIRAEFYHRAGAFVSESQRQRQWVHPAALINIDEIDSCGFDGHEDLAVGRAWRLKLEQFEDLGASGPRRANGFHACSLLQLAHAVPHVRTYSDLARALLFVPCMQMRWHRPLFVHFRVPGASIQARLPPGVRLETEGTMATLSLVAFLTEGPIPDRLFASPLARRLRHVQLNLRTYVRGPQGPGLVFLDVWSGRSWTVLARLLGWPYHRDSRLAYEADDSAFALRARGITVRGLPATEPAVALASGSPEQARLDRFVSYGTWPTGGGYCVRVSHSPWRGRPVALDPDTRIELEPFGRVEPVGVMLADSVDVRIEEICPTGAETGGLRARLQRLALSVG